MAANHHHLSEAGRDGAILVIDYEEHTRGGHFGHWLNYFSLEFARRFAQVVLYTPNAEKTKPLLQQCKKSAPPNINFCDLPPGKRKRIFGGRRRKCTLEAVFRHAEESIPGRSLSAFVMWGYDLLEPGITRNGSHRPWATLTGLSAELRKHTDDSAERDRRLRELCQKDADCVAMLTPDQFLVSERLPKSIFVPAMQELDLPAAELPVTRQIQEQAAGRMIIASVGMLTGPRCVNEALQIAARHPGLFMVLAGKLCKESLSPEALTILDVKKPSNVLLIPGFLDELTLNAIVNASDALLVDGSQYPVHSSVANKALHFRKFLLTPDSDSWMRDTIEKWNVGLAYKTRDVDFAATWQEWKKSAGPASSRRAAAELMSEDLLRECFDELARRLCGRTNQAYAPLLHVA